MTRPIFVVSADAHEPDNDSAEALFTMNRIWRVLLIVGLLAGGLALFSPSSQAGPFRRGWNRGYGWGRAYPGPAWGYRTVYRPYGPAWGGYGMGYRRFGWGLGGYPAYGVGMYGVGYPGYGYGYGSGYPGYGGWVYPGGYGSSISIGGPWGGFYMGSNPF